MKKIFLTLILAGAICTAVLKPGQADEIGGLYMVGASLSKYREYRFYGTNITCDTEGLGEWSMGNPVKYYENGVYSNYTICMPENCDNPQKEKCFCNKGRYPCANGCCNCPEKATCEGQGFAPLCNAGYYLYQTISDEERTCRVCPENATCDNNSFACNTGYILNNDKCEKFSTVVSCPGWMRLSDDGCCCVMK